MSTCILYKQLGEVGGVLQLTSPSQFYLHSTSAKKKKKKNPQNPFYPAIASIASEWLTTKPLCKHRLSTSARRPPYARTITHIEAHICSATHTPTHSLLLFHSQSSLTVPHTLIYTSSLNSRPHPSSGCCPVVRTTFLTLFLHPFFQLLLPLPFHFSHPRTDHIH